MSTPKYEYGKWVETEVFPILRTMTGFKDLTQVHEEYSRIDGVIFNNLKVTPVQIKAISPRVLYQDISIKKSQFDVYKQIAEKNGEYVGILISSIYNPAYNLDYRVYRFKFSNIKYTTGPLSKWDNTPTVYLKLRDMEEFDILPESFQREMEKRHNKYIVSGVSEKYKHLYKNKF